MGGDVDAIERRDKGEEAGGAAGSGWLACARGPLTHHVAGDRQHLKHPILTH